MKYVLVVLALSGGALGQSRIVPATNPVDAKMHESPPPVNVLVVVLDDMGQSAVGTYANDYPCVGCGSKYAAPCTPNIDQVAAAGVRFTNTWSSPVCTPTRAQLLTGKQAVSLGIGRATDPTTLRTGLDPDEVTLADLAPVSAAIGKWHLSDTFQPWTHPLECGFDDFLGTMWNLAPPPKDGPDYWDWRRYDAINPPVQQTQYATEVVTDDAIARLALLEQEADPWFLYVGYHAAHTPYHCAPGGGTAGSFPCPTDWWAACGGLCTYPASKTCSVFSVVQALDYHLGRLLEHVDWSDTALILVGDNGTVKYAQNAPFWGSNKGQLYQGGVHVPLIVRAPGAPSGVDVHALVQVSDVFATVADLIQVPIPATIADLDSVSIAPYLNPAYGPVVKRDYVYAELFEPNFVPVNGQPPASYVADAHERAIRNDKYKLTEHILPGSTVYGFFLMHDPNPGAPPLPQYPAVTPDPHELYNLMDSMQTWSSETTEAFLELASQLQTTYSLLPMN
jgi:arylsulfatase A-like enzyme